jgi:D-alanyl-D-alanine endopeptidase (penicillin-binding protein 7)
MVKNKYNKALLVSFLSVCLLLLPVTTGFSKSSKHQPSPRKYSAVQNQNHSMDIVLRSSAALVEDQQTGEYLVAKNTDAVLPIASITKLMTAMVVLDAGQNLDQWLTIEKADIDTIRNSHSRLPIGTMLTRRDTLLIALMASDNRSAHALGRTYPGGYNACIQAMNKKARSLGLWETRFSDTSGLSNGNVSSPRDLVRLVDAAYRYGLICEFSTCREAIVSVGNRQIEFRNTNQLIRNENWEIGLSKTGFTWDAGRCLVMQAYVADRSVVIVLLDSQGTQSRVGDANRIKKWLEEEFSSRSLREG